MSTAGRPCSRRVVLGGAAAMLASTAAGADAAETEQEVVLHGSGGTEVVGRVRMSPTFMLTLVSAAPAKEAWVRSLVARMNGETTLQLDAPPPPGSPRFALASRAVGRSDPRFGEAMREELRKYYDIELRHARPR